MRRKGWGIAGVLGFLLLALAQHSVREAINPVIRHAEEALCKGGKFAKEGKALLKRCLDQENSALCEEAVQKFESAAHGCFGIRGRSAEATAILGAMQCLGLGMKKDLKAGKIRIREAHKMDQSLFSWEYMNECNG